MRLAEVARGPRDPRGPAPSRGAPAKPCVAASEPVLTALPKPSADFPDKIVIDGLRDEYGPSEMPHAKIVAHLLRAVQTSTLARVFHGRTETLCSGCHHESPVGERPPSCRSCHSDRNHATEDRPALKAAYHRQCIGCHEEMKLKAVGCTDCHDETRREGSDK